MSYPSNMKSEVTMKKTKPIVNVKTEDRIKTIDTIERGVDQFMKDHVIINTSDPESEKKITKGVKDHLMKKARKEAEEVFDNE